jgi:hypothetical protein
MVQDIILTSVFYSFKRLVVLDLGSNNISAEIPFWIRERNPSLRILRLRSNLSSGSIPW